MFIIKLLLYKEQTQVVCEPGLCTDACCLIDHVIIDRHTGYTTRWTASYIPYYSCLSTQEVYRLCHKMDCILHPILQLFVNTIGIQVMPQDGLHLTSHITVVCQEVYRLCYKMDRILHPILQLFVNRIAPSHKENGSFS